MNAAVIILAAGASKRFGSPKQLAVYRQEPLLRQTCLAAIKSKASHVIVVVDKNALRVHQIVSDLSVHLVMNENVHLGMSGSIKLGVEKASKLDPSMPLIISVADQPHIKASIFDKLIDSYSNNDSIVASEYDNKIMGVPVLFGNNRAVQLSSLTGDEGAKRLIKENIKTVQKIDFPLGSLDVDYPEDLV